MALELKEITDYYPNNFVILDMHDGWVAFRSSGTEPKIKYYSELYYNVDDKSDEKELMEKWDLLNQRVATLCKELLNPEKHKLKHQQN